jgi:histidine triad (HIT) family protein
MDKEKDCLFCKIIKKEIPSAPVYEDNELMGIKDINPQAPVHVVIMPKTHISRITDAKEQDAVLLGKMLLAANRIARDHKIDNAGFRVVLNCNQDGGQTVFHIHLHLLGGRGMRWPPG